MKMKRIKLPTVIEQYKKQIFKGNFDEENNEDEEEIFSN